MNDSDLDTLLADVRSCRLCEAHLPLGPRPVVRMEASARLMIIGQAPGTRVHESGVPWDDASGERLRNWLEMDKPTFYDHSIVAIMPMGFCYPGRLKSGGDAPPRPECAPQWHEAILGHLPDLELTLLVGTYAQKRYLKDSPKRSMTDSVRNYQEYLDHKILPLPHPSWRTVGWQNKNPWFEAAVLPELRRRVHALVTRSVLSR